MRKDEPYAETVSPPGIVRVLLWLSLMGVLLIIGFMYWWL